MLSTLKIENSPFNEQQLKSLQSSIGALDPVQSQWLSGYLAGRLAEPLQTGAVPQTAPAQESILSIIYATETGNSESIATDLAATLEQQGIRADLHSMDNFRPAALRKLKNIAFVISTHGEGDPPDEALELFEYLDSERAPKLPDLKYRILALGDSSYQLFCEAGRQLDKRLQALGAKPFGPRVECDVDYIGPAGDYATEVLQYTQDHLGVENQADNSALPFNTHLSLVTTEPGWSRQQPFSAEVELIQKITGFESDKDVYHLELSLQDSGLEYQAGDALGVWADNDPIVVTQILEKLAIDSTEIVRVDGQQNAISDALSQQLEITRLTNDTVLKYASESGQKELEELFTALGSDQQHDYLEQRQLADLVDEYPGHIAPQALVDLLRPLAPRSYSIASSQQMVDEEVHLTVATLHSNATGTPLKGVASGLLNHRLQSGQKVKVFAEPNRRFRLPEQPDAPIIMIAAGTGIAPYRAFMQELELRNDSPESWLIFGNPHLRTDFLYQKEWLNWRNTGLLNRIDTAWSRDQDEKHYVQNVIREQTADIDHWLQRGAHIYLCGSLQMGQAVQEALHEVLIEQRGIDAEGASALMTQLRREHRIRKDLY